MAILRPAQANDLKPLSFLVQDFFNLHRELKTSSKLMSVEEARRICKSWLNQYPLLIYEEENKIIGFARLRQENDVYWLEDIGIARDQRGHGHGRALLTALESYVQERGQNSLYVFVLPENTAAIEFYVNNGYRTLNMIELRKDLTRDNPNSMLQASGRNFHLNWKTCHAGK